MPSIPRRPIARRPRLAKVTAMATVLAAGLALHGAAQAQVLRCTDPATGKVTYTDGRCGSGATEGTSTRAHLRDLEATLALRLIGGIVAARIV